MRTDLNFLQLINGILYVIYARKSSEDKRQVASIPDQLIICHKLEEKLGIKIPEQYIFTDEKSAKEAYLRPGFNTMCALIEKAISKGIKVVIIAWNINRLSRNGTEGGIIADKVTYGKLEIFTDTASWFNEKNYDSVHRKLVDAVVYSKETSLGVKKNMEGKVSKGICPTHAHLGYMFNPTKLKGEKDVIKRSLNWDKCREWVELMLTGQYTVEQSLQIMTARGLVNNRGQVVSKSKAYFFFKDIYNTGLFLFHKEVHQGIHPPLMTMREYQRLQDLIQSRGGKKQELESLPHMGQFKCGCGCGSAVTGESHLRKYKNGNQQFFSYYHSTRKVGLCVEKSVSAKDLDTQIKSYIDDIEMVPEFVEWLKKVIKRQNKVMYKQEAKEQELQTKRLAEITRQKFELREMKTEGFFPDEQDYLKKKEELLKQEQLVKQEIVTTDDGVWDTLFEDVMNFTTKIKELYNSDDPMVKRMVVDVIGLNFNLKDRKLKIEAKNAFIALHQIKRDLWEKNLWIEPVNIPLEQPKQAISDHPIFSSAGERS